MASDSDGAQTTTITERAPVVWQEVAGARIPVGVRYLVAADQSISFVPGSYDQSRPLTIDPTLIYSTCLGGSGVDSGTGIAVDGSGNAYVAGETYSANFPIQNPLQSTFGGYADAFIARISDQSVCTPTATAVPSTLTNTAVPPTINQYAHTP